MKDDGEYYDLSAASGITAAIREGLDRLRERVQRHDGEFSKNAEARKVLAAMGRAGRIERSLLFEREFLGRASNELSSAWTTMIDGARRSEFVCLAHDVWVARSNITPQQAETYLRNLEQGAKAARAKLDDEKKWVALHFEKKTRAAKAA